MDAISTNVGVSGGRLAVSIMSLLLLVCMIQSLSSSPSASKVI